MLNAAKNLAPLSLVERGQYVEVPQGSRFVAHIGANEEISLDDAALLPAKPPAAAPQPAASSKDELSVVTFTSVPDHAEITVDGKFFGTTPSSIRLPPGDHSVTIEKSVFKPWQRIMTVGIGADVSLDVTLEERP